jgi:citrate/tricarballylate utilization protein
MHATSALAEADRLMTICNSCRYCEGLCAVFPAMEMRRSFADGDLDYLANLCHNCGACFDDCQFSPPHEFAVNVPRVLAEVRRESYARNVWPRALSGVFDKNGIFISVATVMCVAASFAVLVALRDPAALVAPHIGEGAFYRLIPHDVLAVVFGAAFLFAIAVMLFGARTFWRGIGEPAGTLTGGLWQATDDAARLRYLDGGGAGCGDGAGSSDNRRFYHHLTFYGFLLCFASTVVATLYHYGLGREAPYPLWDLPVVLGTLGGAGLVCGPIGLFVANSRRDPNLKDGQRGMEAAFLVMLMLLGVTGLMLLALRSTAAMGPLLLLHLGVVFGFFVTMPYGKFVHGMYRYLALVRYARERHAQTHPAKAILAGEARSPSRS